MAKEALEKIKTLSQEDVIKGMRAGDVIPPTDKVERDEFLKFASLPVSEKANYLMTQGTSSEGSVKPPDMIPPEGSAPQGQVPESIMANADATPATPPSQKVSDEWWKELGYDNTQKAAEAHKNLIDLTSKQQEAMDRLNAKEGKRGQELKRLKEDNDKLTRELSSVKRVDVPSLTKPEKPKKPNIKEFENGAFDEKYIEAVEKYDGELDGYLDKINDYNREVLTRDMQTKFAPPPAPKAVDTDSWDELFNQRIPEFQGSHGLVTTVPIKKISDCYTALNNKMASQEERALASTFLQSVPPADLAAYTKIKEAVELSFDFSTGVPLSNYRTIGGALFDMGLVGDGKKFNTVKAVPLNSAEESAARERARQQNLQTVSTVPAQSLLNSDGRVSDSFSGDEKKNRYRALLMEYNGALNSGVQQRTAFETSEKFKELTSLRVTLGFKKSFASV